MRPLLALLVVLGAASSCGLDPKLAPVDLESAKSPVASDFGAEATLASRWSDVQAFWAAGAPGSFVGVDGVTLRYRVFAVAAEKGAIVFVPGRTEPVQKHAETFQDLTRQGYSVFALDPRGQGASDRMLADREVGYVEFFKDYVDDLDTFVRGVVRASAHPKVFFLGHSMGGAIGLMHLYKHPGAFDAVALSAPMVGIDTGAFPSGVAGSLALTACGATDGAGYAVGQGPWEVEPFDGNVVSHSRARYELKYQLLQADPSLRLGGVSWRWLCEALTAAGHLVATAERVKTPTLMLQAGSDTVVRNDALDEYCEAARGCQKLRYDGAYHEIFSERDDIRNEALARVVRFFDHFAGR